MRMTSLGLILALASGAALVGCESTHTAASDSDQHSVAADHKYDSGSAVSEGSSADKGIQDNRNTNSANPDAPRAGSAMTPEERRVAPEGPSASNGDTNRSPDARPGTATNPPASNDNLTPRAGSAGVTDNNNVNRSSDTPSTQPAPRQASDE